ncbi:MAG: serine/threonine protein kinase [Planctomycetes bacterium]|nr:serine/threonine protein kinase [Planctomycetota bacterium]
MTPQRWRTVKELAAAASELSAGEQCSYLVRSCGDDIELHREVVSLLEAAKQSPAFVERPAIESLAPELTGDAQQSLVDRQFGSYQIVRLIAVGGMGSVYLGRRADQEYQQEVAIKVIRGSFHDGESYRRFCQERQTLANLNHPNIARLLDGGRSEDGLPYLVMEYVAGQSIDAFCIERNLNLTGRLRLFREVCGAVHYAHQNLIVHRDLKPSNILVNAAGEPKLLDFGIATVIDAGGTPPSMFHTLTVQRCLTPDYASPEQIRGEPVTTASDVYSLGVLLLRIANGPPSFQNSKWFDA